MLQISPEDQSIDTGWQDFCGRTQRSALISEHARVRASDRGDIEISPGWYPTVGAVLVLILAGAFATAAIAAWRLIGLAPLFLPGAILASAISIALIYAPASLLLRPPFLKGGIREDHLTLRFGFFPRVRLLGLKRDEMEVRLDAPKEIGPDSHSKGIEHSLVVLMRLPCGDRARVFQGPYHQALPVYWALAGILDGDRARDDTLVAVQLPAGQVIEVSKAPISMGGSSGVTAILSFPSANRAILRPSGSMRLIGGIVLLIGVAISIALMPTSLRSGEAWLIFVIWSIAPLFAVLGFYVMLFGVGPSKVIFDREVGVVEVRWARLRRQERMANLIALQIASRYVGHSDGPYTVWEVNLVLREPAQDRVNLLAHGREDRVRDDARALAEFLNVPLIDHS